MRRSRIKVMATVPARRKVNRDIKDEVSDSANAICKEAADEKEKSNLSNTDVNDAVDKKEISDSSNIISTQVPDKKEISDSSNTIIKDAADKEETSDSSNTIIEDAADKKETSDSSNTTLNESVVQEETTKIVSVNDSIGTPNKESQFPNEDPDRIVNSRSPLSVSGSVEILATKPTSTENVADISKEPENAIDKNSDQQNQISITISEQSKNIPKVNCGQEKMIVQHENVPNAEEAKTTPNFDTPPVNKVSQTRTSFMRPTPRFDGGGRIRRNSVQGSGASASESEDDTRKTTNPLTQRKRNDSVSSMQSPKATMSRDNSTTSVSASSAMPNNAGNTGSSASSGKNSMGNRPRQKRKMIVSESARKLVESRRDFFTKYEHKQPDRGKLTMYDLIYYNPITNPMKKPDGSVTATQRPMSSVIVPEADEEDDDDCDAGDAMPVPQVKVGPDGHLVIDEQSLVIENTGAKKSRQALARTEAFVDEETNGSGFYKKRRKTKDWSKWETLKFYKALNNVGTDFLLMQSLFPSRSRHEIKMKFKKEERTNHRFVEKALTYHQEFDIESLQEDLATFEESENRQCDLVKSDKTSSSRQAGGTKRRKNKSRRMVARSIDESNEINETNEPDAVETTMDDSDGLESTLKGDKKRAGQRKTAASSDTRSITESTSSSNELSSDTEIYHVKPTRSGRLPKVRKLQAPKINTLDNLFSDPEHDNEQPASPVSSIMDNEIDNSVPNLTMDEEETLIDESDNNEEKNVPSTGSQFIENSVADIAQVEPGSLVIVSRESTDQPGETVFQVYMVSTDNDPSGNGTRRNMTPISLTPESLNTVTAGITKVAPINVNTD